MTVLRAKAWTSRVAVVALGVGLLAAGARADIRPDEKDRGPDAQGRGVGERGHDERNPLVPILDLMRQVQQRLAEADSGRWTQAEQKRIVEALKFGENAVKELDKLIELAEQQSSSSGGGGSSSGRRSRGGKPQRRRSARQRQSEGQRQAVNPQQRSGQPREQQDNRAARNDQRRLGSRQSGGDPGSDSAGAGRKRPSEADRWGDLPMKEVREALDARRSELPPRWRALLERYYRRLAESQR
ncbi:MAG: hypothetical protein D6776_06345 [Planctomycetota bacterium]|nr:MAG: hypothetical protein D6776_06345 [Planctomycetota bacterium]